MLSLVEEKALPEVRQHEASPLVLEPVAAGVTVSAVLVEEPSQPATPLQMGVALALAQERRQDVQVVALKGRRWPPDVLSSQCPALPG